MLSSPKFELIRSIAVNELTALDRDKRQSLYVHLQRGVSLLNTHEQLCQYLFSYGQMHQAKLLDAFKNIPSNMFDDPFEIVDWGCGQAMGSVNLLDHLRGIGKGHCVSRITLIEPSAFALQRGVLHLTPYRDEFNFELRTEAKFFEDLEPSNLNVNKNIKRVHIFSNILDVPEIDLKHLAGLIDASRQSDDLLVCVGPLNPTNQRIDWFFEYFDRPSLTPVYQFETSLFGRGWTYKARVFHLESTETSALRPLKYYPPVQCFAAYELDAISLWKKQTDGVMASSLATFDVTARFDFGASIYSDVHPRLAVLNNIITRGLPTRSSPLLEDTFAESFGFTQRRPSNDIIAYDAINSNGFEFDSQLWLDQGMEAYEDDDLSSTAIQFHLSPIAIARFQKVLIEALIANKLDWNKSKWTMLVEELDVPFAHLGLADFVSLFNALNELAGKDSFPLTLPEIELHVLNSGPLAASPLHAGKMVAKDYDQRLEYDLVLSLSMSTDSENSRLNKSNLIALNGCHFQICTSSEIRSNRTIYTSDLITYRDLVARDSQGRFEEIQEQKSRLRYFLQLLFRKVDFRPGQLPILHRALKNEAVIGLLPTGGGKSLTYQLATLLQPGIAIVIDPLKSLMKDQVEGLLENRIDTAVFINSSLDSATKKANERKLEASQAQFVFLSPERLSMSGFRERLENMHSYNVYFSYGVIDEVHCVSEWGHDFRFSYLHVGRNLYNFVRAKSKEISLFGLTATASFDVLADVERELSGSGMFNLDSDVIVRHENTNRLELQYKVELVPVAFDCDDYYDQNKRIPDSLPRAVNIRSKWAQYNSKGEYAAEYVRSSMPQIIEEAQNESSIHRIKEEFSARQSSKEGTDLDIRLESRLDFSNAANEYDAAGIIFCPHVEKTGISVREIEKRVRTIGLPDVVSYSGKHSDAEAEENLSGFRKNNSPLMVATKAFGMGMDKPNVRFTINMNYSSSLESFVQEAGRAGRDRKLAVATILVSDYELVQVKRSYPGWDYPLGIMKTKWFRKNDLEEILKHFGINLPEEHLTRVTPADDVVKLFCSRDNKMFAYDRCDSTCPEFQGCNLRLANEAAREWLPERELISILTAQGLNLSRKHFQYLNADYQTMMFFYNSSFKGDVAEKRYMFKLLGLLPMTISHQEAEDEQIETGFLQALLSSAEGVKLKVSIPFADEDSMDLQKAIYRMTCIELVQDFTHDFDGQFRLVVERKPVGGYFDGLRHFLHRYYTSERAEKELSKAMMMPVKGKDIEPLRKEIYQCLAYLTEFVYEKISEKRKRALDDIRDFCLEGIRGDDHWLLKNERLKDFIYYYFNSKFAKTDYVAENGEPFSLLNDTEEGKRSSAAALKKYLRVIDDDVVGIGTPLDNVKHLFGAVRLIRRSLTDANPTLDLLEAFCLAYMGIRTNKNLQNQFFSRYSEGILEFEQRGEHDEPAFWHLFDYMNQILANYLPPDLLEAVTGETKVLIHSRRFNNIRKAYLD